MNDEEIVLKIRKCEGFISLDVLSNGSKISDLILELLEFEKTDNLTDEKMNWRKTIKFRGSI